MKFTSKTKDLLASASFAAQAVKTKSPLPILSHILIEPDGERLKITGTDLDLAVSHWCAADISNPEAFCIPAKKLVDLLGSTSVESVQVEVVNGKANITLGMSNSKISIMPASEFVKLPAVEGESFSIMSDDLAKQLKLVSFAVASGIYKTDGPTSGIKLELTDGKASFVGTDGRKIANSTTEIEFQGAKEFVLPADLFAVVASLAESEKDKAVVWFTDRSVTFSFQNCSATGKMIEANYPNWRRAVPESLKQKCSVSRTSLIESLNRASLFGHVVNGFFGTMFEFGQSLSLSSKNPVDEFQESIASTPCEPVALRMNHDFMLQFLSRIEGESVTIEFTDPVSPVVIRENDFMCLTMPLRN